HTQDDDWHTTPFAQPLEHFRAFEIGQAKVEQDHVGSALRGLCNAVLACRRIEHAITVRFQRDPQQAAHLRFVINDQCDGGSFGGFVAHSPSSTVGGFSGCGKRIVNIAPPPGRLSAVTVPSCASTKPLTMVSPSPLPPVGALGARKNL